VLAPLAHLAVDRLPLEGDFRDQDDVRAAGESGGERDPAGVAAHDLDYHDAMMRGGRGMQAVNGMLWSLF